MLKFAKVTFGIGSFAILAALPLSVSAEEITATGIPLEGQSIAVSYADLNLDSQSGVDALTARVRSAARKVCGVNMHQVSLEEFQLTRACFRESFDAAQSDIRIAAAKAHNGTVIASLQTIKVASR